MIIMKHADTKSKTILMSLLCAGGLLAATGCERGESTKQPEPVAAAPGEAPARGRRWCGNRSSI